MGAKVRWGCCGKGKIGDLDINFELFNYEIIKSKTEVGFRFTHN